MPYIKINGCNYYYEHHNEAGTDETILFSHGLLWSGKMFDKQVEYFKQRYQVVTYDHRGQGNSEVTDKGYDMDQLYEDAVSLIGQLGLGKVHFVGLSMGGFVGMRLAARKPDLVKSLILMETSAEEEPNKLKYSFLVMVVKLFGVKSVTNPVMNIMFGDKFLNDPIRRGEKKYWEDQLQKNDKTIVRAVGGVISRQGIEDELKNIQCPTLIMVGKQDKATLPAKAEFIHHKISNSQLKYIDGAGHSSSIEEPEQVIRFMEEFLLSERTVLSGPTTRA